MYTKIRMESDTEIRSNPVAAGDGLEDDFRSNQSAELAAMPVMVQLSAEWSPKFSQCCNFLGSFGSFLYPFLPE